MIIQNKVKVKNIHSGSRKAPPPYSSWIEYWEANKNVYTLMPLLCPKDGGLMLDGHIDGAHVKKVDDPDDNSWYIIPLCEHCNRERDDASFFVDENLLVPVNQENQQPSAQTQSKDNFLKLKSVNEMLHDLLGGNSR